MNNPAYFLSTLRDLHRDLERQCLNGSCFRLFLVLREVYQDAVPYYDGDHVITEIGGKYWDIRGEVMPGRHTPMEPEEFNKAFLWGKSQGY